MKTACLVDGSYLRENTPAVNLPANLDSLSRSIRAQSGSAVWKSIYYDVCGDIDAMLASSLGIALRAMKGPALPFDLRLEPVCASLKHEDPFAQAHRLLIAEMAVSAISFVMLEKVERLVIAGSDVALEPSIALTREHGLREFWHVVSRGPVCPALRAHADRTIWLDELF
jgi:hypothetical protein